MPTYREDLHTGHKVPLVESDDIMRHAIHGCHISCGAITADKIAPGTLPWCLFKNVVLPWFEVETDENGDDWLTVYYADDGAIKDFTSEDMGDYIEIAAIITDGDDTNGCGCCC